MKINIVCDGWLGKDQKPVDWVEDSEAEGILLSQYHAGTTFEADIKLDPCDEEELENFLMKGYSLQVYILPFVKPATEEESD